MADGAYRLGPLAVDVVDGVARVAGTDTIAGSTATMDQVFRLRRREQRACRATTPCWPRSGSRRSTRPGRWASCGRAGRRWRRPTWWCSTDLTVTGVLHRGTWVVEPALAR